MKKTDLEKLKGLKINNQLSQAGGKARFGQGAAAVASRKDQRKLDQARGLIPFATKLNSDLVQEIQALAAARNVPLNELVEALIRAGLAQGSDAAPSE